MSSPTYATDHGNGLVVDQYGSNSTLNGNSSSSSNNNNNGSGGMMMMSADQSSATIIGAMKPYTTSSSTNDENDKSTNSNSQVSSLPTSSTTLTISPSNNNNNSNATFSSVSSMGNGGADDVCRDYLRNLCRRGKSCRYKHPDNEGDMSMGGNVAMSGNNRKDNFVFCHDFQNRECRRENCRFLHCSKQEEEIFRTTGKIPNSLPGAQAQALVAAAAAVPPPPPSGDGKDPSTPICKDFINGICRRAPGRCKFRHPTSSETYNQSPSPTNSRNSFDGRNGQRAAGGNFAMCPTNNSSHNLDAYGRVQPMAITNYGYDQYVDAGNPNKRKRYDSMYTNNAPYGTAYNEAMNTVHGAYAMHSTSSYYGARSQMEGRSYLEEENAALRQRIDTLKKQVADLLSTNEYLMEQINQMRVQNVAAGPAAAAVAVATATSVASLPPPQSSTATAMGISSISAGPLTQTLTCLQAPVSVGPPPPPPPAVVATPVAIGPLAPALPPSSIVSSIASISLPTVTAPVTALVNSMASGAATLVSYTPMHSSWSLGVDQ